MNDPIKPADIEALAAEFNRTVNAARTTLARAIVGRADIIDGMLYGLFGGGHILIEGAPGLGKTKMALALSQCFGLAFRRIQFTPDVLPMDITGTPIPVKIDGGGIEYKFQAGPLFSNIVLADEINRAIPKTQSALLEAMQEGSVTTTIETLRLPDPFIVIATQNPIEMEGTFPLPEAQIDRFLLKLTIGSATETELTEILRRTTTGETQALDIVATQARVSEMRVLTRRLPAADSVLEYASRVVTLTNPDNDLAPKAVREYIRYGASPRGAQAMVVAGKVRALLDGRYHLSIDDLRAVAAPALRHRLILNFNGRASGASTDAIIGDVLSASDRS
ncbi:MAG: AAA family ATPase [Planctomycetota bacterium]